MNTATHALVAIAGFQRKTISRSGWFALLGALLPDAFLAVFILAMAASNTPNEQIWEVEYFQEPWTTIGSISNSFPLWFCLLAVGLLLKKQLYREGNLVTIVSFSGLSHLILDFFTHADDAHQHFWPLSSWRFESPFSYWDVAHNAVFVMPFEGCISLFLVKTLWRRTASKFFRFFLILLAIIGFALLFGPLVRSTM